MGRTSNAKKRLINSAIALISTRSYTAVGVQKLCEHAGIKKGSFYHFFPSKRDLTLAALDVMWENFREQVLEPTFNSDLPPMEKFHRFIDMSYKYHCSTKDALGYMTGCHIGNLAVELSTQDEVIRQKIEEIFQKWASCCEHVLNQAVAAGDLPTGIDPRTTAQAILAYIEGILLLGKTFNDPSLITRLGQGVAQLAISGNDLEKLV
jgi:TetR/AcrR family transcriptional regulator, transcriptional repressor for nem operon